MDDSDDVDVIQMIIGILILLLFLLFFRDGLVMVLNWILDSLKYIVT